MFVLSSGIVPDLCLDGFVVTHNTVIQRYLFQSNRHYTEAKFMNVQFRLRFLDIIWRVSLRLEVSGRIP